MDARFSVSLWCIYDTTPFNTFIQRIMHKFFFNLICTTLCCLFSCSVLLALDTTPSHTDNVVQGDPLEIEVVSVVNASCNGAMDGSITINVIGGIGNYSINWSTGAFDVETISGLGAGSYGVTVTDDQPETVSMDFTITHPNPVQVSLISQTNITCASPQANIQVTATGGSGGFSYNWGGGITGNNINVSAAGLYTVTATDGNNCTGTLSVDVTADTQPPTISAGANQSITCPGGNVVLQGTGPTGAQYTILWTTSNGNITSGASTYNPVVNAAGTYTLAVTNNTNGCQSQATTMVTGPPAAISITLTPTNITCAGLNNGQISSQVSGGGGGYMYSWSNMATTQNISNLGPGSYTLTVTDANGCTATSTTTITSPSALTVNVSTTNQTQVGVNNGTATANPTGGTGGYTYAWSNSGTTQTINNLQPGNYSVTVTDGNGCTAIASGVVTGITCTLSATINISGNINCFGGTNGALIASPQNAQGTPTYLWSTGATTQQINNLGANSYQLTITDGVGCTATASINLTQPSELNVSVNATQMTGVGNNDGAINSSTSGGTGSYNYLWSNGASTQNISNLAPGIYTLTVSDANGCTKTASATINEVSCNISVNLNISTTILCNGGQTGAINSQVTGNSGTVTYNWSNGATTNNINNVSAGNYTLTVTDNLNCTASATISLTQPAALIVNVATTNQTTAGVNNGSATANTTGGTGSYSYNWNTGGATQTINNLAPGTYTVTVTDQNGCTQVATGIVSALDCNFTAEISIVDEIDCFGNNNGVLTTTTTGGNGNITYQWSNGSSTQQISNLGPGNYQVTATDANNCMATASQILVQPSVLTVNLQVTQMTVVGANDGSITAVPTGGTPNYSYLWSTGSLASTIDNLAPDTYSVAVTDGNECVVQASATINDINCNLAVNLVITNPITCFGEATGAISAQATNGQGTISYAWSTGATGSSVSGLTAGSYSVTTTDNLGCISTASITLSQPSQLSGNLQVTQMSGPQSNNGSMQLTPQGGTSPYTYLWSTGATQNAINSLAPGTYTVTLTDANSCQTTFTGTIDVITCNLVATITLIDDITCFNAQNGSLSGLQTGGEPPVNFLWSNGATDQTIDNLGAGTYGLTATDSKGCTSSASFELNAPAPLNIQLNTVGLSGDGANDGSISSIVTGGTMPYNYLWNTGATTSGINSLAPGTYSLTVTDAKGCVRVANTTINGFNCNLGADIEIQQMVLCFGNANGVLNATPVNGVSPFSYEWSTGSTDATVTNLAAGIYEVTIMDGDNCEAIAEVELSQPSQLQLQVQTTQLTGPNTNDGAVSATNTGGSGNVTYLWSNGATTQNITGLGSGTYCLTITDENDCSTETCITIQEFDCDVALEIVETIDVSCFGGNDGSVEVVATGGLAPYTFVLDPDLPLTQLPAGLFYITAVDDRGCTVLDSFNIQQPQELRIIVDDFSSTITEENTGFINIDIQGGTAPYNIIWTQDGSEIDVDDPRMLAGLNSGIFEVEVVDSNGCIDLLDIIINLQVSTIDSKLKDNIILSPNPANETIYLHSNTANNLTMEKADIRIFDLNGNTVYASSILGNTLSGHRIEIANLISGFYLLQIRTDQEIIQKPFVKQ